MNRLAVAGVAIGVTLLVEVLRVWAPSLLLVYGEVKGIPDPLRIATAAVLVFLLVVVLAPATVALLGPRRALVAAATALVATRLGLQVATTVGGTLQVVVSSLALLVAAIWLCAVAAGVERTTAAIGIVLGFALDFVLHAVLGTVPLAWQTGVTTWVALIVLVGLFAWAALATPPGGAGPAWPWIVVGPALALHGVFGTVSHLQGSTVLGEAAAAAVLAVAHVVAVLAATSALGSPSRGHGLVGAGFVLLGLMTVLFPGMPFETAPVAAAGHAVLVVGIGLSVSAVGWVDGHAGSVRRAAVSAAAMLVFLVVVFGYYASHDIALPFPREVVLAVAVTLVAAIAGIGRPRIPATHRPAPVLAAILALAGLLCVASIAARPALPEPEAGTGLPVRVGLYNLHFGFDTSGRLALDRQADVIASLDAEIVGLQEVDRAWFVTSNVDILARIAERLGMPYVFGGAADDVWGNAILSRYEIVDAWVDRLPRDGAIMPRSVLTAIIDIGGQEVAVMSTHLSAADDEGPARAAQARRIATLARALMNQGLPVIAVGDFNAEPGDADLEALRAVLGNATAGLGSPPTWPSWEPVTAIDHIYVSPDLQAADLAVPRSDASDHLAVAVTVGRVE